MHVSTPRSSLGQLGSRGLFLCLGLRTFQLCVLSHVAWCDRTLGYLPSRGSALRMLWLVQPLHYTMLDLLPRPVHFFFPFLLFFLWGLLWAVGLFPPLLSAAYS